MTVRELIGLHTDKTDEIYVQENSETITGFAAEYMKCVKDEILGKEVDGYRFSSSAGEFYMIVFTKKTEVVEIGTG